MTSSAALLHCTPTEIMFCRSQSFKKGQATAPELNRSSEDSAGVLQNSDSEGSRKIVEMFGEEGNFRLDDQNTDDLPPFLCQSDSGK